MEPMSKCRHRAQFLLCNITCIEFSFVHYVYFAFFILSANVKYAKYIQKNPPDFSFTPTLV